MSGRSVPSQLDQVLPRFSVQKPGSYHPFGRIRIAPFGKGVLRILGESAYSLAQPMYYTCNQVMEQPHLVVRLETKPTSAHVTLPRELPMAKATTVKTAGRDGAPRGATRSKSSRDRRTGCATWRAVPLAFLRRGPPNQNSGACAPRERW